MNTKIKEDNLNIKLIWSGFTDNFGEPGVSPKKWIPKCRTLERDMLDSEILSEWKPDEVSLDAFSYCLKSKEGMLLNGYANIFYIRDQKGILRAVVAYWDAGDGGWRVGAHSVGYASGWDAGGGVVSRKWLSPSDTLTLETHNEEIEVVESLITKIKYLGKVYKLEE